jgi:phosphomannomutase
MLPLLDALGCRVVAINTEMDGRFPRDPEPTAANLGDLCNLVAREGADLGLAVDPDVDRLSLVNEKGVALGEDLTLALAAAAVLRRTTGVVVTNLSTSQAVEDVVRAYDGTVVRAPVGEINVARAMQAEGAVVGGEGNGGVIFPELHHTRDAAVAAVLILQNLVDEGSSLSEAAGRWPEYAIVKRKISFPRESLPDAYRALEGDLESETIDRSDGLRLSWSKRKAWLHVRPSGTEPIIRLIAEAPDRAAAEQLIQRAERILKGVI